MNPDPPPREDGICARPGCDRQVVVRYHSKVEGPIRNSPEPFCSSDCCRAWHGVERLTGSKPGQPRKEAA